VAGAVVLIVVSGVGGFACPPIPGGIGLPLFFGFSLLAIPLALRALDNFPIGCTRVWGFARQ
jgi:uncharacterized membrane protein YhdT